MSSTVSAAPDPFQLFGLSRDASWDQARAAFRAAVRATHPDRGGSETQFQLVQAAWEDLQARFGASARDVAVDVVVDAATLVEGRPVEVAWVSQWRCWACDGAGCGSCESGLRARHWAREITVPAGVGDGDVFLVSEVGNQMSVTSSPGNLRVGVHVRDGRFDVVDGVVICRSAVPVPVEVLVAGGTVTFPGPASPIVVDVPECTQPGAVLEVPGRGLRLAGGGRGPVHVEVDARFPSRLDDRARRLWTALADGR